MSIANDNGGDWNTIGSDAPVVNAQDTGGTTAGTRLTAFFSRYNGTQTAPVTNDSGDHQYGCMFAFRGVVTSGAVKEAVAGGVKTPVSTTVTIGGSTTTGQDRLVLVCCSREDDAAGPEFSNWANADLANLTEQFDDGTTAGGGGGFALVTGEKAVAGAFGNTTADVVSSVNAFFVFALIPAVTTASSFSPDERRMRRNQQTRT